jgi:cardiolipin synthase A/B
MLLPGGWRLLLSRRVVSTAEGGRRTWLLVAAPAALALAACAHSGARTDALQHVAAEWPVVPTQAWISGHRLSMVFPGEGGPHRASVSWKEQGLDEQGYRFRVAELALADLTSEVDERPQRARPVTILDTSAWGRLSHAFRERLAPATPGEATLILVGGADRLLWRDTSGQLLLVPSREAPPGLRVSARRNNVEIAEEAARFIEAEVTRTGVTADVFLLVLPPREQVKGLLLFDTSQRLCVAVTLPRPEPRREGSNLSRGTRTAVAIGVESHVLALLKNPVSSFGRLLNLFGVWVATVATRSRPTTDVPVAPLAQGVPMDLAAWELELDRLTGRPPSRGSIRLLVNGERYFPVLEQRIREARESIAMRVNIFDNDDVALHIADLLRERSHEISVRVIMDQISTIGSGNSPPATAMPPDLVLPASMWRYLEHGSNVSARAFLNPWLSADHSKLYMFDRRYAHIGGMNIGREYRYEWHDMMVELEGPVVGRFARDFERGWAHASALGDLAYVAVTATTTSRFAGEADRDDYVAIRPLYTRTGDHQIYRALMGAVERASSYVWLENPYLYENSFVRALVDARRRGVDVRVVLPSNSDLGAGNSSNMVTANALLANGVRVYVYPGMTHVKAAIIDSWACLGSANFNKLSLRRNFETNIAISDARFVDQLRRDLFERDFADSHELTDPVAITSGDRFAEWVMSGL